MRRDNRGNLSRRFSGVRQGAELSYQRWSRFLNSELWPIQIPIYGTEFRYLPPKGEEVP